MWPPSGSPARSAGSRLTAVAGARARRAWSGRGSGSSRRRRSRRRRPRPPSGRRPRRRPSRPRRSSPRESRPRSDRRAPPSPGSSASTVPSSRDDPGEHHHSRSRALASMSSPLRSPLDRQRRRPRRRPAPARRRRRAAARRRAPAGRRTPRSSSTSPAPSSEPASSAPPSTSSERDPAARRARRAPPASRRSRSPASSITSAPAARSAVDRAAWSASGGGEDVRAAPRSIEPHERRVERQPRRRVEDDPGRLARRRGVEVARGEQRVVGERGADPDRDRVGLGAPAVHERPALGARDPARVAARGRGEAVEADARTSASTSGRPVRACLRNGWIEQPGGRGLGAVGEVDLDPLVAQDARAAAARLLARVVAADHHPGDPGGEDRVGARRLAALVRAGLERSRTCVAPAGASLRPPARDAVGDRGDLGVRAAELGVKALADHLAVAR